MPEVNGNNGRPPEDAPKPVAEVVKKPPTPEERRKAKFALIEKETDKQRSERRARELKVHFDVHMLNVKEAHEAYPAPMHRDWTKYSRKEQENWNARRKQIDMANRAYHLAVRRTFKEHLEEDAHLAQVRKAKEVA